MTACRDGELYAAHNTHHRRYDAALLASLPIRRDWRILDVGCGVGDLTARLAGLVPAGARTFRACAERRVVAELRCADDSFDLDFVRLDVLAARLD